ncbi:MAG TPA: 2-dehydro-3-deoxyphosphooctonate aldolase [Patescibacteria group bacterium]|nr:2-dehydro-3-deoxyphosphooctonate aldolase [Patescibacteria group bacterium]
MKWYLFLFLVLVFGCSSIKREYINQETFKLRITSTDSSYGYSPENSIKVGSSDGGPKNQRRFLNALLGPNSEPVQYHRLGSCCPVKSSKAIIGDHVLLDRYAVYWAGGSDTLHLYLNMYDEAVLQIPMGFKAK